MRSILESCIVECSETCVRRLCCGRGRRSGEIAACPREYLTQPEDVGGRPQRLLELPHDRFRPLITSGRTGTKKYDLLFI